jgi:hypothetical protein
MHETRSTKKGKVKQAPHKKKKQDNSKEGMTTSVTNSKGHFILWP